MNKESLMTILPLKGNPYTWNDSLCIETGPRSVLHKDLC